MKSICTDLLGSNIGYQKDNIDNENFTCWFPFDPTYDTLVHISIFKSISLLNRCIK